MGSPRLVGAAFVWMSCCIGLGTTLSFMDKIHLQNVISKLDQLNEMHYDTGIVDSLLKAVKSSNEPLYAKLTATLTPGQLKGIASRMWMTFSFMVMGLLDDHYKIYLTRLSSELHKNFDEAKIDGNKVNMEIAMFVKRMLGPSLTEEDSATIDKVAEVFKW